MAKLRSFRDRQAARRAVLALLLGGAATLASAQRTVLPSGSSATTDVEPSVIGDAVAPA